MLITEIRLAAGFLTIIPVGGESATAAEVAASFGWFPLIGFILGAILTIADYMIASFIASAVRSALLVLALTAITGAIHLDGLADTADALSAGRDRARALEILRDSRIGTFGAVAVFFVLALKVAALASAAHSRSGALYLAPGIARWAMVAVPYRLTYLREYGAGSALLGIQAQRNLRVASLVTLLAVLLAGSILTLRGILVAIILVWIFRAFYTRWLGGVTGDLIGAAGEIIETATLIALTC
ncbi:MAG: adenosylcobinamide-GDP ribazoletransferase [Deltaproteobacteria bacterium]|nr:adenosylcobinamide-GDP ribazoletransferase [Deltaproteobacteria bacterium]